MFFQEIRCNSTASVRGTNCRRILDLTTGDELFCYTLPKLGTHGIGQDYDLQFDWKFDQDNYYTLSGNWSNKYGQSVDFIKGFENPGFHTANLRVTYIPLI